MDIIECDEQSYQRSKLKRQEKNHEHKIMTNDKNLKDDEVVFINNDEIKVDDKTDTNTIKVDFSAKIDEYGNTLIKKNQNLKELKVLGVFDDGKQMHLYFSLSEEHEHTVADLVKQISGVIPNEIEIIYPVNDPINYFSYIINFSIKMTNNVEKRSPQRFEKRRTRYSRLKRNNLENDLVLDLTMENDSIELDDDGSTNDYASSSPSSPIERFSDRGFSYNICQFSEYLQRNVKVVLKYPLPPHKHETIITVEDFQCLNEENYLNDIIIEFYLKYLFLEKLSLKNRNRIHVFNTYFYSRLNNPRKSKDKQTTQAQRRYSEVQRWTKKVDIFSKDFLIIPVCQDSHWMLAIVCYPSLILKRIKRSNVKSNMEYPCIMLFDSLSSMYRYKTRQVTKVLKSYLKCEYASRKGAKEVFEEDNIKVIYPKVPQQDNMSDCGIYLLQFVESFFEEFVSRKNFQFPMKDLGNWFDTDMINCKRNDLKRLLIKLADGYKINGKRL